ncbi:MAG: YfbM family protein [Gemmataceae bacterium]
MAGRGGFNTITPEQMERLLAIRYESDLDDEACDEAIMEEVSRIEEAIDFASPDFLDIDKAWEAIHRCLTGDQTPDGMVNPNAGRSPLRLCVLGGVKLIEGDHHIVALVKPVEVLKVADALAKIDKAGLRKRFFRLDPEVVSSYPIDDDEFEYTWSNFARLPTFYRRAADQGRAILFIADT